MYYLEWKDIPHKVGGKDTLLPVYYQRVEGKKSLIECYLPGEYTTYAIIEKILQHFTTYTKGATVEIFLVKNAPKENIVSYLTDNV